MKNARSIAKLNAFFNEIAALTSNHDVINDHACVTADKLGEALEKVDPEWWEGVRQSLIKTLNKS
jgi:hypothetical protein